jgi:hypothetical protein
MAAKAKIDWGRIEPAWRAGILSVMQIAAEYTKETGVSVTHTAINKHFKTLKIPRDLKAKIKAKAEAMVSAAMVSGKVSTETIATEAEIINTNAGLVANALLSHKRGIARAWNVVDMLMRELEHQSENIDLYEQLGELMHAPDKNGVDRLNEIYRKAMSLPSRSSTVKTLLDALKTAIGLEREALGITDRTPGSDDDPLSRIIKAVQGTGLRPVVIEGESEVVE